ncbi:hypothetical protein [Caldicellulosiruptor acetigenus]|uniref:hypothetical protein n=1 Tax=Caldicellulosiruptor acetigenus TaxID=301953 RepID=UPI0004240FD9|nr:hypothetical protein [Caldicellulosiruptor acetigenus]WAM35839.1 hypothetical protein OTK01_002203 [Caldicellulosiruptor acetigenus]
MRKKILLVLLTVIGINIIAAGVFVTFKDDFLVLKNNKPVFTNDEPVLIGLKFGSTKGELIKKLGNPKKIKREWWGAYGDYVEYCYYDWGYVLLVPGEGDRYIINVEISKKGIEGPRGIEVGDCYKRVLNRFRYSPIKIDDREFLYYLEQKTEDGVVDRFGSVVYNEKGEIESIYYRDSSYYWIDFEISKGRVKKIVAYHHNN